MLLDLLAQLSNQCINPLILDGFALILHGFALFSFSLIGLLLTINSVIYLKGLPWLILIFFFVTSLRTVFRHFFFTVMLFVYGRILSQRLVNTVTTDKFLYKLVGRLIKYHMVTCYFLYIAGWYK